MTLRIANPIYDVVFKYLMSDQEAAKLLLSKLMDEEIVSLELKPTEHQFKVALRSLTVYRIDFAARIKASDGSERMLLIEIQKAKMATDIMRFRKYLGGHYQDSNNVYEDSSGERHARSIFCIYFLGHTLTHIDSPVVRVKRDYYDVRTQRQLKEKDEFIESLTHDSIVVQIPKLQGKRRTELEVMLSLFDQSRRSPENQHFIEVEEEDFPEAFRPMIRRLLQAAAEKEVCDKMDLEDELISDLADMERTIAAKERALEEKTRALREKTRALREKTRVITEKDHALEEKDHALEENARALARTRELAIDALTKTGLSEKEAQRMILGASTKAEVSKG